MAITVPTAPRLTILIEVLVWILVAVTQSHHLEVVLFPEVEFQPWAAVEYPVMACCHQQRPCQPFPIAMVSACLWMASSLRANCCVQETKVRSAVVVG